MGRVGSELYMAPELRTGESVDYDSCCDMWSLGITLCTLLTGCPPIDRADLPFLVLNGEFSCKCHHFIRRLLMKNRKLRFTCQDAITHCFVMPIIVIANMIPSTSPERFIGGWIREIDLGQLAWNKQVRPGMESSFLNRTEIINEWNATWKDVFLFCQVTEGKEPLILTKGGKFYHVKDTVEYSYGDNIIHAVFLRRNIPIPRFDPMSLANANACALDMAGLKNADVDGVKFFRNQFMVRHDFCYGVLKKHVLVDVFRSVTSMDYLIRELFELQNDVCERVPAFPTVAFTEQKHRDLKLPSGVNVKEALEPLNSMFTVLNKKLESRLYRNEDIEEYRKCLGVWASIPPCKIMKQAVDFLNSTLDEVESDLVTILQVIDYVEILRSTKEIPHPLSVVPQLTKIAEKCPCLRLITTDDDSSNQQGAMTADHDESSSKEAELVSFLEAGIKEKEEECARLAAQIAEQKQRMQEFMEKSAYYINGAKSIASQLKESLTAHGVDVADTTSC